MSSVEAHAPSVAAGERTGPPCRFCGSGRVAAAYTAREMMYATGEPFTYHECAACGSVQIAEIPEDLARHYPADYYSYGDAAFPGGVRGWMATQRLRRVFAGRGVAGAVLQALFPHQRPGVRQWLSHRGARGVGRRILDVGCGSGKLLRELRRAGYTRLLGVDPFIPADLHHPDGVIVLRADVSDIDGEFDVVMMHHVLEHVPDPLSVLQAVARLLAPDGYALVRVPTVSSRAWDELRERWPQLDPPRHLAVPSLDGLREVARRAGLRVDEVVYDAEAWSAQAAELYAQGLPMAEIGRRTPPRARLRALRREARALNRAGRGDQVAAYLSRA